MASTVMPAAIATIMSRAPAGRVARRARCQIATALTGMSTAGVM